MELEWLVVACLGSGRWDVPVHAGRGRDLDVNLRRRRRGRRPLAPFPLAPLGWLVSLSVFSIVPFVFSLALHSARTAQRPAMGWNTWCTISSCDQPGASGALHDVCSESEMMSVANALLTNGMYELGYNYINADDCWANPYRNAQGELYADPTRFPNGWKAWADWLHSQGLRSGLYTSAGSTTCASGGRNHSIPGSFGYYELDAQTFASWGVD